jgi:CDP-diacylglycerol---serine O-phosphatidyltransferase
MIRGFHLADAFTLANAACGMASVFSAMTFLGSGKSLHFFVAAALVPVALVFDILDGRVARRGCAAPGIGRCWPVLFVVASVVSRDST